MRLRSHGTKKAVLRQFLRRHQMHWCVAYEIKMKTQKIDSEQNGLGRNCRLPDRWRICEIALLRKKNPSTDSFECLCSICAGSC